MRVNYSCCRPLHLTLSADSADKETARGGGATASVIGDGVIAEDDARTKRNSGWSSSEVMAETMEMLRGVSRRSAPDHSGKCALCSVSAMSG